MNMTVCPRVKQYSKILQLGLLVTNPFYLIKSSQFKYCVTVCLVNASEEAESLVDLKLTPIKMENILKTPKMPKIRFGFRVR